MTEHELLLKLIELLLQHGVSICLSAETLEEYDGDNIKFMMDTGGISELDFSSHDDKVRGQALRELMNLCQKD